MENEALPRVEQLCRCSIEAGVKRLCKLGAWPRPPAARRLRIGYDFYYDDMRSIPEADELVQYLASDGTICSIYFGDLSKPELYTLYDYWVMLLLRILSETEGTSIRKRVFKKWFGRFLKELYSDSAVWKIVDTVTGVALGGARLKLDGRTSLVSVPGYDLQAITGKYWKLLRNDMFFDYEWHAGGYDKAIIITTARVLKHDYVGFHWPPPHLTQQINRSLAVIDAIRLTKPGVPRLHCHAQFHLSWFPLADPISHCNHEGDFGLHEAESMIDESDFREVRKLWQELMATKYAGHYLAPTKATPLDVALGRFSRTYVRQNWLDDMVDLTIALESLFGPKDNLRLRHRIAQRAAWLLGRDAVEYNPSWTRDQVFKRVRTMYDVRSARVHGGIPKEKDICKWVTILSGIQYDENKHRGASYGGLLEYSTESARGIVREAIKACARLAKMDSVGPHWPLPKDKDFDKLMLSPKQRRKWQKAAGIRNKP